MKGENHFVSKNHFENYLHCSNVRLIILKTKESKIQSDGVEKNLFGVSSKRIFSEIPRKYNLTRPSYIIANKHLVENFKAVQNLKAPQRSSFSAKC